jgi:hypothetical protein
MVVNPEQLGKKLLYHPEVAGQRIALPTLLYLLIYNKVLDLAFFFYTTMAPFKQFNGFCEPSYVKRFFDQVRKEVLKLDADNNSCFGPDLVGKVKL